MSAEVAHMLLPYGDHPLYSVDTNALVGLKDYYPADVFGKMWGLVEKLAVASRFLVCEQVRDECHDPALVQLLRDHAGMVIDMAEMHHHFGGLMADIGRQGLSMTRPGSDRHLADPYVVALALMLEQRNPADLGRKTKPAAECIVVTGEKRKGPGASVLKIPNACGLYGLGWTDWLGFLRREKYTD